MAREVIMGDLVQEVAKAFMVVEEVSLNVRNAEVVIII